MIVVNARFLTQKITGVQRYAYEIAVHLRQLRKDVRFISPMNIQHPLYRDNLQAELKGKFRGHVWEQLELPGLIPKRSDILLSMGNTAPVLYPRKIVTIHDTCFLNTRWVTKRFSTLYKMMIPRMIESSMKIVTVSDFSRQELMTHFQIPEHKISVIPNAVSRQFRQMAAEAEWMENPHGEYILAVSSIEPRKNFPNLIRAFNRLKLEDTKLLIVGSRESIFHNPELSSLVEGNPNIHFTGYVTDRELAGLYRHAKLFVFPSFYEGFGIPPLEAMACGCPTVVSRAASLPEVCGDASHYVDPESVESIASGITDVLTDEGYRNTLIERGKKQVNQYDWDRSARQYLQLVESL